MRRTGRSLEVLAYAAQRDPRWPREARTSQPDGRPSRRAEAADSGLGRRRLELPPLSGLDPKSSASTSFAICPGRRRRTSLTPSGGPLTTRGSSASRGGPASPGPRAPRAGARRPPDRPPGARGELPRAAPRLGLPPAVEEASGVLELDPGDGHAVRRPSPAREQGDRLGQHRLALAGPPGLGTGSPTRLQRGRADPRRTWTSGGICTSSSRRSDAASASLHLAGGERQPRPPGARPARAGSGRPASPSRRRSAPGRARCAPRRSRHGRRRSAPARGARRPPGVSAVRGLPGGRSRAPRRAARGRRRPVRARRGPRPAPGWASTRDTVSPRWAQRIARLLEHRDGALEPAHAKVRQSQPLHRLRVGVAPAPPPASVSADASTCRSASSRRPPISSRVVPRSPSFWKVRKWVGPVVRR